MQNLNVNITPDNYPQSLYYSQNDVGREFKINITDFTIPVGATVKIQATKPSGFGFSVAGAVSGNSVTFETTDEMTDEAGRFPAELVIESGAVVIGTANFLMVGEMNPHPEGTTDGSQGTIIPELTLLVERVEAAASSVLDMQVVAQTLPAGSQASYSYDEDLNKATFGIPEGQAGAGAAGVVASAYSAAKTYKVGDYVLYNSNLYRCTTAITTAEAWTAAHWTQIVLADDVTDLKTDSNKLFYFGENLIDPYKYITNNNAVVSNNDGSYTVGTTDYGRSFFGISSSGTLHFEAGEYYLFGVPEGFTFIATTNNESTAVATNETGTLAKVTIPEGNYYIGLRIASPPSESYVTRPYIGKKLPKVDEVNRQIIESNAKNLLLLNDKAEATETGITYSLNDNVYTISGNHGDSIWFDVLYSNENEVPSWFLPGRKIYIQFDTEGNTGGSLLQIYKYVNGSLSQMVGTGESVFYTIPSDFNGSGLLIRIRVPSNTTVNFTAKVGFLTTMGNDILTAITHKRAFKHNIAFFGDSIMWGRDGDGDSSTRTSYTIPIITARSLAITGNNFGVGGMGFISNASSPTNAYGKISATDLTDYDTIVLCFGVNDGFSPIGTWDSTDEDTCLGQFNKIVNYIYQQKPSVRLIVIAPFNGRNVGTFPKYWYGTVPSTAYSRGALSDALKQACEYYNIPYIEQTNSPINGFTVGTLIGTDGVHPSNEGYKRIGEWISGELARLIG